MQIMYGQPPRYKPLRIFGCRAGGLSCSARLIYVVMQVSSSVAPIIRHMGSSQLFDTHNWNMCFHELPLKSAVNVWFEDDKVVFMSSLGCSLK